MCEFKVYLKKNDSEEVVAEDIVYALTSKKSVILKGILGNQSTVENASILEADVKKEKLVLIPIE